MFSGLLKTSFWFSVIFLASIFSSTATAQWYSSGGTSESVSSISVSLVDNAKDACWTNLREVREYAEEKLRLKRYNVVADDGDYTFEISVGAFRDNQGWCVYSHQISIEAVTLRDNVFGFHNIGRSGAWGVNKANTNKSIISIIQSMIAEM